MYLSLLLRFTQNTESQLKKHINTESCTEQNFKKSESSRNAKWVPKWTGNSALCDCLHMIQHFMGPFQARSGT